MCITTHPRVVGAFENSNLGKYIADRLVLSFDLDYMRPIVIALWNEMVRHFPNGALLEPDAMLHTDYVGLMIAFDNGDDHLEFEIMTDSTTEVFYIRRSTNEIWETTLQANAIGFSISLIDKLRKFAP